jgi:hypothetical protein
MAEYTNLLSQLNTFIALFNNVNDTDDDEKKHKAKFVPIVFYGMCSLCALLLAISYFRETKRFYKYPLILLAAIFNIPFILFFSIMEVRKNSSNTANTITNM